MLTIRPAAGLPTASRACISMPSRGATEGCSWVPQYRERCLAFYCMHLVAEQHSYSGSLGFAKDMQERDWDWDWEEGQPGGRQLTYPPSARRHPHAATTKGCKEQLLGSSTAWHPHQPALTTCASCCRHLQKSAPDGTPTQSAHPARFSPDDKFSRERTTTKRRFNLLPTQHPPMEY